jgi:predicted permease
MPGRIVSLFRNLLRKRAVEQALDEELESSLDTLTEERMKEGYSRSAARRQALMELGGVEQVKQEVRAVRAGRLLEDIAKDLRFAFRTLAKSPGFTAVAVLTLALGIGANTAIFTVVHDWLFSPRPYPDEAQVVQVYTQDTKHPSNFRAFSYPTYADIREQSATKALFSGVLAHNMAVVSIGEGETSRRTFVDVISSNYFRTLEVPLAQGRGFLPEEEKPGSAVPVVIASYAYWQKTGFDPQLVGKTTRINERPFTVVGITPKHFSGTMMMFGPELYFPLGDYDLLTNGSSAEVKRSLERRDVYALLLVGRLKPGVTAATAGAALLTVAANLERALPVEQKDQTFLVRPLPRLVTGPGAADPSGLTVLGLMLCALAAIVLVVACLNLAGVLLARGLARRKEIAIRLALGGGRSRIIRQLLTEGLVVSLAGGAGGFLIGLFASQLGAASLSAQMPVTPVLRGGTDPAVIVATLGFCALATLFFALGPALKLTRPDLITDLKEQAGEDSAPRRHWWLPRNLLVVAQVALSLGLITAAGLFIRGALKAGSVETGFKADSTILIEADASLGGHDPARTLQLYRAVCDRLAALPGVQAASIASTVPYGLYTMNRPVRRAGVKLAPDAHPTTAADGLAYNVRWSGIGADYFATMGLPLLRGREFTKIEAEIPGAPPVAIVDEVLAKKLWPEGEALGQRIEWAESTAPTVPGGAGSGIMGASDNIARRAQDPPSIEIVGIVPPTRWEMFQSQVGGQIYVPYAQDYRGSAFFQVRTSPRDIGADAALFSLLRREVRSAAPGVPVFNVKTFRQQFNDNAQLWFVRSAAAIVSLFGSLALVLAVVGVYGVVAYGVARRTREIGIRTALGAEPGTVLRMILREGLTMTLGGAALGFLFALGIGRVFSGMLYQVSPMDPAAFTLAPVMLMATALLACWFPARRAAKLDPLVALRNE